MCFRRNITCLCACLTLLSCAVAAAEPVAIVGGRPVEREQFGAALIRAFGRNAITGVVDWALVEQEARARGITVTEREVRDRRKLALDLAVQAAHTEARLSAEEYEQYARERGEGPDDLRKELAEGLSPRAVRARLLAERMLADRVDLSDKALRDYYERTRGVRYLVAHILTPGQAEARRMVAALEARPELWSEMVLHLSLDRDSVPFKGRLAPIPASTQLGSLFEGMGPGDLRVHESEDGWQVFRLISRLPASGDSFDEVKDRVRAELLARETAPLYEGFLADLHRRSTVVVNLASDPAAREQLGAGVAAFVNGEPIAMAELAEALIERLGRKMLGSYIERMLIIQEAERRGITVAGDELQTRMAAIGRQLYGQLVVMGGPEAGRFKALGMAPEEAGAELVRLHVDPEDVRATLLAEKMVAGDIRVSDAEVNTLYAEWHGERVEVKEAVFDTYAEAGRALSSLRRGVDFDTVAQAGLRGPGLWMTGALERTLAAGDPSWPHVAGLEPGDVSDVFERGGRYRIIEVLKRIEPADPPPLESVRESLVQEVRLRKTRARARAFLQKLEAEARRSGTIEVLLH